MCSTDLTVKTSHCHKFNDYQLHDLAFRLRMHRFTLLVIPSQVDAESLLRTRLMPLLSRRSSDVYPYSVQSEVVQDGNRRTGSHMEVAWFFENWRAMHHGNALEKRIGQLEGKVLLVMAGLGDALREARESSEACQWLESLAQAYWGLGGCNERPLQLLLAIDREALPLLEMLRLYGLPVDEAMEYFVPNGH